MVLSIQCSQVALAKVICHAAKHLSSAVNGVFIGTVRGDTVTVTDAIPLFHTASINLAVPNETALAQISAHAEEVGTSYSVVGYYHSDARFVAGDLSPVGRRIADKIAAKQPSAVVLILDNKKLASFIAGEDTPPFEAFTKDGAKGWHRQGPAGSQVVLSDSNWKGFWSDITGLLKQRLHTTLADFDDHLDDINKDYLNPQLKTLGKFQLPGQAA